MELRELSQITWKWFWLIVLATIVSASAAYFASRYVTPVYRATTVLLISEPTTVAETNISDILTSERLARSYTERLSNRHVLEQVIGDTGLAMTPDQLESLLSVSLIRDTQLIELSVEHPNPNTAMLIANEIPKAFSARNEQQQSSRFAASKQSLEQELAAIEADIAVVEGQLTPFENADEPGPSALEQRLGELRSGHSSVLSIYEELRIAEVQLLSNIIIDEEASLPTTPVRPRTTLNSVLAATVGAMMAFGVVLLVEYLDDTLKNPIDVTLVLGLPTLAPIPQIRGIDKDFLVAVREPRSPGAEAFRALRTNIQYAGIDRPIRSILVTSSREKEGKTVVASNLATVIALAGKKVILVDSDLRRPALTQTFRLPDREGLTDVLFLPDFNQMVTWSTQIKNLKILPAGSIPPNPAELIGSDRMQIMIDFMTEHVDFVVFDSPPLLAVTDAALLANRLDGVIIVVEAGRTRRDESLRAVETLRKVNANVLGIVLNKMSKRGRSYYNYYSQESSSNGNNRRERLSEGQIPNIADVP